MVHLGIPVLKYWYPKVNQQRDTVVFPQTLQIQSDHLNNVEIPDLFSEGHLVELKRTEVVPRQIPEELHTTSNTVPNNVAIPDLFSKEGIGKSLCHLH